MTGCTARRTGLSGYTIDACRCAGCTAAQNAYNARRRRYIAYQQWQPYVDAEPVRAHVRNLMAAGIGWMHICRITGVANGIVSRLLYGTGDRPPSRRIRPGTAAAILAVQPELSLYADRALIDATGTRRRIQALAVAGWPVAVQARRLGRTEANYHKALHTATVRAETARAVARLYDELSAMPAPGTIGSRRAKAHARRHGWMPPAAWDDDIDDPAAIPNVGGDGADIVDEVAVQRAVRGELRWGQLTRAEQHVVLRDHGRTPNLAKLVGASGGQLKKLAQLIEAA